VVAALASDLRPMALNDLICRQVGARAYPPG
jgi:hypothetical protein